jgi:tellurite resistance protein
MPNLELDGERARVFVGGLLSVCRADGIVNGLELNELRRTAAGVGVTLDENDLLFGEDLEPPAVAAGLGAEHAVPFLDAALRVALADGELHESEREILLAFARSLERDPAGLRGWQFIREEPDEEQGT